MLQAFSKLLAKHCPWLGTLSSQSLSSDLQGWGAGRSPLTFKSKDFWNLDVYWHLSVSDRCRFVLQIFFQAARQALPLAWHLELTKPFFQFAGVGGVERAPLRKSASKDFWNLDLYWHLSVSDRRRLVLQMCSKLLAKHCPWLGT